ncbi:unnamed protein product, partial [Prunus brigantina]
RVLDILGRRDEGIDVWTRGTEEIGGEAGLMVEVKWERTCRLKRGTLTLTHPSIHPSIHVAQVIGSQS